eukprot:694214-Amphidinium_carterae.1
MNLWNILSLQALDLPAVLTLQAHRRLPQKSNRHTVSSSSLSNVLSVLLSVFDSCGKALCYGCAEACGKRKSNRSGCTAELQVIDRVICKTLLCSWAASSPHLKWIG